MKKSLDQIIETTYGEFCTCDRFNCEVNLNAKNKIKSQIKAYFLSLAPEELVNTKEEENSDWFFGYGYNASIVEYKANIEKGME